MMKNSDWPKLGIQSTGTHQSLFGMQWLNIAEWMIHWIFNRQLQVAYYSGGFSLASAAAVQQQIHQMSSD